jgi:precorrin-6B methylase 2
MMNDSPQSPAESAPSSEVSPPEEIVKPPQKPAPPRARRSLVPALLVAGIVIGTGSAGLTWALRNWKFDPTALDRPWINAPYVQTPMNVVEAMLELAEVKESDVLYDLGCGDGRIAIVASEQYGCRSVGYDIEPDRIRDSRENAKTRGVEDLATFEEKDVFTLDLSQCDVAAMYLLPRYMTKLIPQFQAMKPGSRIVAHDFSIEGVPPDRTIEVVEVEEGKYHFVHLWITPLKIPEKKQERPPTPSPYRGGS